MRARNIKPGLLKNELLGTADPLCTILFTGLWMLADRDGRLEDRPLRIKAEVFPYREGLNIEALLGWLAGQGFITRYTSAGARYIQISKFSEHQTPHVREPASRIPAQGEALPSTAPEQGEALPSTSPAHLIPDSLIPDSGFSDSRACDENADAAQAMAQLRAAYPQTSNAVDWLLAERACRQHIERGARWPELIASAERYARYCAAVERHGQYVQAPQKFFSGVGWRNEWALPATKAQVRQDRNVEVATRWANAGE